MGKISIGLRGWRFDEEVVFDDAGNFRPMDDIPAEDRQRLVRLVGLFEKPCDACWLVHGDENLRDCNVAEAVYGEPLAEVVLCGEHERDFYFWYLEAGGERFRGDETFQDRFHEWFAAGNRAPECFEGVEHVETGPADVPRPETPDLEDLNVELPEDERVRIDLRGGEVHTGADADRENDETLGVDDLDTEYPTG